MNIAKRAYKNDLEHLTVLLPLSLANGFFYPTPTACFLGAYLFGRTLYTAGYFEKEGAFNKRRMGGSLLCNAASVGTFGKIGESGLRGKGFTKNFFYFFLFFLSSRPCSFIFITFLFFFFSYFFVFYT